MKLTLKQQGEFHKLTDAVMNFLNDHTDPHTIVVVTQNSAQLFEGNYGRINQRTKLEVT